MNQRQFAKYLARDLHCPCGCVGREETLIPQHRINRGIGGSKALDRPSNIIVLCSRLNWLIESDPFFAEHARGFGWKLETWQSPEDTPFLDRATGTWYFIDNHFNRTQGAPAMTHAEDTSQGTIINPTTDKKTREGICSSCDKPLNTLTGECAGCSD